MHHFWDDTRTDCLPKKLPKMSFLALPFEDQCECQHRESPVRILGSDFCEAWETDEDDNKLAINSEASVDSAPSLPTKSARPTSFASLRADTTRVDIVSSASSTPDSTRSRNSIWEVDVADLETMWAEPDDLQQIRVEMVIVELHISDNNTLGMELCSIRGLETPRTRSPFRREDENTGPSAALSRKPATNAVFVDDERNAGVARARCSKSRRTPLPARGINRTRGRAGKKDVILRRIVHGSNPHLDALVSAGYLPPGSIIKYFDGQFVDSLDTIKAWAHDAIERHRSLSRYGGYGISVELGYLPPPNIPHSPLQAPWTAWDAETLPLSPQRQPWPQPANNPKKCLSASHSQRQPQPSTCSSKQSQPLSPRRQSRTCVRHRVNIFENRSALSLQKSRSSRRLGKPALRADCP